jgi:hypothetical protein
MLQRFRDTKDWQATKQLVLCDATHMLSSELRLKHEEART